MAYSSVAPIVLAGYYIVLIFFWNTYKAQRNLGLLLIIAIALSEGVIKNIIQQPRPAGACANSYGMPSSHAAAMAIYFIYAVN